MGSDHPFFLPVYRYRDVKKVLGISAKNFQDLKMIFKETPLLKGKLAKPSGEKHNWVLLSRFEVLMLTIVQDLHSWLKIPFSNMVNFCIKFYEVAQGDPEVFEKNINAPLYLITDLKENISITNFRTDLVHFDKSFSLNLKKYLELLKTGV